MACQCSPSRYDASDLEIIGGISRQISLSLEALVSGRVAAWMRPVLLLLLLSAAPALLRNPVGCTSNPGCRCHAPSLSAGRGEGGGSTSSSALLVQDEGCPLASYGSGRASLAAACEEEQGQSEGRERPPCRRLSLRGGDGEARMVDDGSSSKSDGGEGDHQGESEGEGEEEGPGIGLEFVLGIRKRWVAFSYEASRRRQVPRGTMDEVIAAAATGDATVLDAERIVSRALEAKGGADEEVGGLFEKLMEVIVACAKHGAEQGGGEPQTWISDAERTLAWMRAVGMDPAEEAYRLLIDVGAWAAARGGAGPEFGSEVLRRMRVASLEVDELHYEAVMGLIASASAAGRAGMQESRRVMAEVRDLGLPATRRMHEHRLATSLSCAITLPAGKGGKDLVDEAMSACAAMREAPPGPDGCSPAGEEEYGKCGSSCDAPGINFSWHSGVVSPLVLSLYPRLVVPSSSCAAPEIAPSGLEVVRAVAKRGLASIEDAVAVVNVLTTDGASTTVRTKLSALQPLPPRGHTHLRKIRGRGGPGESSCSPGISREGCALSHIAAPRSRASGRGNLGLLLAVLRLISTGFVARSLVCGLWFGIKPPRTPSASRNLTRPPPLPDPHLQQSPCCGSCLLLGGDRQLPRRRASVYVDG